MMILLATTITIFSIIAKDYEDALQEEISK